ncbi:hypothetical protein, partial [Bradyrhizobium sp. NAS80.1]|uniref:hypothetical protein n=1 Tax=Bradyrhizobium sp. NAS80.1 TaxID=1680159 RepID=UPI001AEF3754
MTAKINHLAFIPTSHLKRAFMQAAPASSINAWKKVLSRRGGEVGYGSWLCENAKALERDRRSYSSKAVLALRLARGFNLD